MNIVYYISGHGYGHAVRSIEVIKSLQQMSSAALFVRTGAPAWLFNSVTEKGVKYSHRIIEGGIVQTNSFTVDKKATLEAAARIARNKDAILEQELAFIRQHSIDLAIIDHTPLAFEIAAHAGIPAVGAANFSWDWILSDYLYGFPEYAFVLEDIRSSYRFAETLYRLPFYGPMDFYETIIDVPLVGRKAQGERSAIRRQLGLAAPDKRLILVALKKQDIEKVNWSKIADFPDYTFIILSPNSAHEKNIINFPEGALPFEELVASCDAVVSKPGYSMVAEVIANKTPMVYVPRQDFVEDEPLVAGLKKYAVCEEMDMQSFLAGEWGNCLDALFQKDPHWPDMAINGAKVIAENIGKTFGK